MEYWFWREREVGRPKRLKGAFLYKKTHFFCLQIIHVSVNPPLLFRGEAPLFPVCLSFTHLLSHSWVYLFFYYDLYLNNLAWALFYSFFFSIWQAFFLRCLSLGLYIYLIFCWFPNLLITSLLWTICPCINLKTQPVNECLYTLKINSDDVWIAVKIIILYHKLFGPPLPLGFLPITQKIFWHAIIAQPIPANYWHLKTYVAFAPMNKALCVKGR